MSFTYRVLLQWSPEDDAYIATIPELPGVMAHGDTPDEAAREVVDAAQGHIEVLAEDGCAVPKPVHYRPYSGQLRLRMPRHVHRFWAEHAAIEGVSLNSLINSCLEPSAARVNFACAGASGTAPSTVSEPHAGSPSLFKVIVGNHAA